MIVHGIFHVGNIASFDICREIRGWKRSSSMVDRPVTYPGCISIDVDKQCVEQVERKTCLHFDCRIFAVRSRAFRSASHWEMMDRKLRSKRWAHLFSRAGPLTSHDSTNAEQVDLSLPSKSDFSQPGLFLCWREKINARERAKEREEKRKKRTRWLLKYYNNA